MLYGVETVKDLLKKLEVFDRIMKRTEVGNAKKQIVGQFKNFKIKNKLYWFICGSAEHEISRLKTANSITSRVGFRMTIAETTSIRGRTNRALPGIMASFSVVRTDDGCRGVGLRMMSEFMAFMTPQNINEFRETGGHQASLYPTRSTQ